MQGVVHHDRRGDDLLDVDPRLHFAGVGDVGLHLEDCRIILIGFPAGIAHVAAHISGATIVCEEAVKTALELPLTPVEPNDAHKNVVLDVLFPVELLGVDPEDECGILLLGLAGRSRDLHETDPSGPVHCRHITARALVERNASDIGRGEERQALEPCELVAVGEAVFGLGAVLANVEVVLLRDLGEQTLFHRRNLGAGRADPLSVGLGPRGRGLISFLDMTPDDGRGTRDHDRARDRRVSAHELDHRHHEEDEEVRGENCGTDSGKD